jgi:hypothetical protein
MLPVTLPAASSPLTARPACGMMTVSGAVWPPQEVRRAA